MTDIAWMRPKLAELCGLFRYAPHNGPPYYAVPDQLPCRKVYEWRPDDDVAQAVRCLDVLAQRDRFGWKLSPTNRGRYVCDITRPSLHHVFNDGDTLPRAICLAIAAALGWEREGGDE